MPCSFANGSDQRLAIKSTSAYASQQFLQQKKDEQSGGKMVGVNVQLFEIELTSGRARRGGVRFHGSWHGAGSHGLLLGRPHSSDRQGERSPGRKRPLMAAVASPAFAREATGCGPILMPRRSLRPVAARPQTQMKFAHFKRILRLGRLRLRGPRGAQHEFVLVAARLARSWRNGDPTVRLWQGARRCGEPLHRDHRLRLVPLLVGAAGRR